MRIGLDFRMLSADGLTVHRGMGRYTRQQLREVLRIDPHNEYVLFCREDADLPTLLPDIAGAPNVSMAWLPPRPSRETVNRPEDVLRATDELQRALHAQDLDLFHLTTPGHLDDLVPFGLDGPLVATHYDLIPLLYPAHYLRDPVRRELYRRSLRLVRRADRLVAISRHVAEEAAALLGIPRDHIRVAPPIAAPCFRPLPEEERESRLAPLRERLGLPGGFLLTVSHLHHAKNLPGLLDAYALLPEATRRELPLVLACELHPAHEDTVRAWTRQRKIDTLALTGFVTDDELAALYNAATIYVHASLAEGFGLPVLEALRCGAAVVAASTTSLPEVIGDAGLLVDPAPAALSQALEALHRDPERREALRQKALDQAATFRSDDLGRETLAAYEEAARRPPEGLRRRPCLALWTPVPPQPSGISDYSVELLRQLVRHADVEVFVDDGILPGPEVADLAPVHLFTAFAWRDRRRPFDAVLYQLGASYFHLYMDESLRAPGPPKIVTLHDLTWGALLYREAALWGGEESFRRALTASEGAEAAAEHAALGEGDLETLPARVEDFLNRHHLLGGVVVASRAQIVHLRGAAAELEAQYPAARVFEFTMGVEDPRRSLDPAGENGLRQRLGIPERSFLIGSFGVADPVKRLEEVVGALERLATGVPDADPVLLIVGGFHDPAYRTRLETLTAELGLGGRVHFLGRTPERDFDLALLACDAVVNLRHPFRHQMSATLMRALAAGRPVVITDVPAWEHFPESFCLRVAPDETEVETLATLLAGLARDPARRRAMGEAARRYWEDRATPARMAHNYLRVLAEVTGRSIEELEEPDTMSERAPSGRGIDDLVGDADPVVEPPIETAPPPPPSPAVTPPRPPAPRDDSALARLEMLYRRWDAVRARSALEDASGGGVRGGLGFASRTAARIRDLGVSWDLQRDLFRGLLDRIADLQRSLEAAEAEIQRLGAADLEVRGALNEMWAVDAGFRATLDEMRATGWDRSEMANLRDRQESLRVRQARLEGELADLRRQGTGAPALPLSPRDFAEILKGLEEGVPLADRPGAVEVSLQDVRAEDLLLTARRHFGGRLSASGPEYRSPNDLWIHVDFSAWWNRPLLLENAAARLAPGGRFVLITATAAGEPPRHPGLTLREDREVELASGGPVRRLTYSTVT